MTTRTERERRNAGRRLTGFDVREVVFTVEDARRALPYVARLLSDARAIYRQIRDLRLEVLQCDGLTDAALMLEQRDALIRRLNEIIDECHDVGLAHINIPAGLAAIRSEVQSRPVTLLWRVGDPINSAWLMIEQPVGPALDRPTSCAVRATTSIRLGAGQAAR